MCMLCRRKWVEVAGVRAAAWVTAAAWATAAVAWVVARGGLQATVRVRAVAMAREAERWWLVMVWRWVEVRRRSFQLAARVTGAPAPRCVRARR